jgi:hypothetical protein
MIRKHNDIRAMPLNALEDLLKILNVKMKRPASPANSIHPSTPFLRISERAVWIKRCIRIKI